MRQFHEVSSFSDAISPTMLTNEKSVGINRKKKKRSKIVNEFIVNICKNSGVHAPVHYLKIATQNHRLDQKPGFSTPKTFQCRHSLPKVGTSQFNISSFV